ncbi:hypothetical protein D3C87_924000 [compost metagenome]|jgi:hypothetical protein|uniref:hypothetical protein n=1 Tax=Variovorax boronicumulans TaxID=436515 RepID=UPI000FA52DF7|nr:hypothetical protein [Variovorax boronicumulans]GER09396.1 hypothetical protein VHAB30_05440 [Variovorax boronicumulans]
MTSTTYNLIRQAILDKRNINAMYEGLFRQLSPHAIGLGRDGQEQALFYQYAGKSKKGLAPAGAPSNWRCLPIAALADVVLNDDAWQSAGNHSKTQSCVKQVDLEVAF